MVSRSSNDRDGRAELAGITWDHPRGLWPLLAATDAYASVPAGVKVRWETRTLQDFADVGIDELRTFLRPRCHRSPARWRGCCKPMSRAFG